MKTIAKLWYGDIEPAARSGVNNAEMRHLERLIQSHLDILEEKINEKELFKKYKDCMDEYTVVLSEQAFCDGFSLAMKIAAESMTQEN